MKRLLGKQKKRLTEGGLRWRSLQVKMIESLLNDGYSWDEIYDGLGISEIFYHSLKDALAKNQSK